MRPAIQFSCCVTVLMLAVLWLCQTPLWAGIYKWRDDQGKIHFTDDKSRIPLKYREKFEKFKGVVEPKPKSVQEPVGAEKEKEVVASEPEAGGEKGEGEATGGEKENPKLVALLKETKRFLEDENRAHQRLIKFVEAKLRNGKHYVDEVRNNIDPKKNLIKKLEEFKFPPLEKARKFLKKSVNLDKREKIGGSGYEDRIVRLKRRMESEIKTKKQLIKQIEADLGLPSK